MMGRTHVTQAAATWLTGCAIAAATHHTPTLNTTLTGLVIIAGAAVLPDCDHRRGTLATLARPITPILCGWIADLSAFTHRHTRTPYDKPTDDGHRGLTHTLIAAPAAGTLAALLLTLPHATPIVIGVLAACATQAMLPARIRRGRRSAQAWGIGATAAILAATTHAGGSWLPLVIAAGWLIHLAGDACTLQGVPLCWPLVLRRQRWRMVGLWQPLRIRTGSNTERWHTAAATLTTLASTGWFMWIR